MKKLICVFISIMISFSASSCQGTKQEVEKIGLVLAIGYDLTPENKYKLTVQVLKPEKESSQGMGTSSTGKQVSSDVVIFSSMGDTPYDAANKMSEDYGRSLFFGHSEYLVIGKKLAESGLYLVSDTILRGQQARPDNILLLAQNTASQILAFEPSDEDIPAMSVKNLIKLQSIRGLAPVISRLEFVNALSSKTAAPILGIIGIEQDTSKGAAFKLSGTGIFRKDKLIGFLNADETRGLQWIKGKVKDGTITAKYSDGGKITFFLINAASKIKPVIEGDNITIKITIKTTSNILEMSAKLDPMKDPKIMDDLAKLESEAIEKEVRLALNAAQEKFDADIFDFGGFIHREYPEEWSKLESNWDDVFPNINIEVDVISSLKAPGLISKPMAK